MNSVRKLQVGTSKFKGKLPFKCFACGIVGHYVAKCPYKENNGTKEKGNDVNQEKCQKEIIYKEKPLL